MERCAQRRPAGDTTADLFDGFDTITEKEIAAGAIAEAEGNYMKIADEITAANAVDIAKSILFSLDPRLRSQDLYLYCSQDFVDKYKYNRPRWQVGHKKIAVQS